MGNNRVHGWGRLSVSLGEGGMPDSLKEAVVKPLLSKPSLDPDSLAGYDLVANPPVLVQNYRERLWHDNSELLAVSGRLPSYSGYGTDT